MSFIRNTSPLPSEIWAGALFILIPVSPQAVSKDLTRWLICLEANPGMGLFTMWMLRAGRSATSLPKVTSASIGSRPSIIASISAPVMVSFP